MEEKENRSYLQTVGRAMEVLDLFSRASGLSLTSISRELHISTTVAYRLLYTMTSCGFLRQDTESKCYYLGDKAILLGYSAVQSLELRRVAHSILWDLYERTKHNVTLTICCDKKSLCIEKLDALLSPLPGCMYPGSVYPLHKGASNRTLLAFLPTDQQEEYIETLPLAERGTVRAMIKLILQRGYDMSCGELTPGLYAIGFPIFGAGNRLIAALSITGYLDDFTDAQQTALVRQGRQAAARISNAMGATSPH